MRRRIVMTQLRLTRAFIALAAMLSVAPLAPAATISNTGRLNYQPAAGGAPVEQLSNTVSLDSLPAPTLAQVSFLQFAPSVPSSQPTTADSTQCADAGGAFGPMPPLTTVGGQPIDLATPALLVTTSVYHGGEPVFVTLADGNRNLDAAVRDTIELRITASGGDEERLLLTEIEPNTGVFAGAIQSVRIPPAAVSFDCRLSVAENSTLTADYADTFYPTDTSTATALVDPFGFVFDSRTGAPIDGATVILIDLATGQPASVSGDDGTSGFPATITTGGTVTDSAGVVYSFAPGGFRFPFVPPG
ncbi:MAG: hypothetical protein L0271_18910, partial [Gemmatimonadetes bacterium]|nr:hypothetical protein [Gemmatimonadota bacterium]